MRLIILTLLLTFSFFTFAQTTITGEVRLKNDNSTLPGVNVIEKGTDNSTNSDENGKFQIVCKSADPILKLSFLGLKTIEIKADKAFLTVYLEEDEEQLKVKTRFGMYPEYTSIGFNSGINYSPIGVNVRNALPVLFGVKMLTTTEVSYRTDLHANQFVDVRVRKDQLINTSYYGRYISLEMTFNKRQISKRTEFWNTTELTIVPELRSGEIILSLGYGRQSFNDMETLKSNQGLIVGLEKYFRWSGRIVATAKKWNSYWQTEFQFNKAFEKNDFEFGIRFETLDRYREIDLLVAYRFHY